MDMTNLKRSLLNIMDGALAADFTASSDAVFMRHLSDALDKIDCMHCDLEIGDVIAALNIDFSELEQSIENNLFLKHLAEKVALIVEKLHREIYYEFGEVIFFSMLNTFQVSITQE